MTALDFGAIDDALLAKNNGRYYLRKGDRYWTGAGHKEDRDPATGDIVYEIDERAFLEFVGPETDDGREAMKQFQAQWNMANALTQKAQSDDDRRRAEQAQMNAITSYVELAIRDWRLFDAAGAEIDIKPYEKVEPDNADSPSQIGSLVTHWAQTSPRILMDISQFLIKLGNF